jgi:hypothetical protein
MRVGRGIGWGFGWVGKLSPGRVGQCKQRTKVVLDGPVKGSRHVLYVKEAEIVYL